MAPQYDFSPNRNWTSDEDWRALGADMRNGQARRIFSQNISQGDRTDASGNKIPAGQLDEQSFYAQAAQAGLGQEHIKQAMEWNAANKAADVNTAQANLQLRSMGQDPNAQGRNGAQIGEPAPVAVRNPDVVPEPFDKGMPPLSSETSTGVSAPSTQAAPNRLVAATPPAAPQDHGILSDWWDKLTGKSPDQPPQPPQPPQGQQGPQDQQALTPDQQAQVAAQQAAPSGAAQAQPDATAPSLGSASLATAPMVAPLSAPPPTTLVPGVDNRSARQRVEDSFDPSKMPSAQALASAQQPADELTTWAPKNDGSSKFTQYQSALDSKLQSNGFSDPSSYLQTVYSTALKANTPTPPNPGLMMMGREGLAKYQGELQTYSAQLEKAKGIAEQDVLKARDGLTEFAKQFGVNAIENEKFGWIKGARVSVSKEGLDPTLIDSDSARDLIARKNTLDGMGRMIENSKADLMGNNGPYNQRAKIVSIVNNLSQIENVGVSEAANERMNTLLNFAPGVLKAFQEGGIKDVPNALAQYIVSNPEAGYAALQKMVQATKEDGILAGQLKAAGAKDPFGLGEKSPANVPTPQPVSGAEQGLREMQKTEQAAQANQKTAPAIKIGTPRTYPNGRTAIWDGKGWAAQ